MWQRQMQREYCWKGLGRGSMSTQARESPVAVPCAKGVGGQTEQRDKEEDWDE